MIYLKYFEDCIKHSDPIAVNHKLRDFSRRLEDIIILLQELNKFDLKNATVKRYFHENKAISITYEDSMLGKLLTVHLMLQENVEFSIYVYKINRIIQSETPKNENCLKLFNFIDSILPSEYKSEMPYYVQSSTLFFRNIYNFPLTELNNVLNKLEEYRTYIDADKYNL